MGLKRRPRHARGLGRLEARLLALHLPGLRAQCSPTLTDAHVLIVQLSRAVAVVAQAAMLAVLAPRVVFATDTGHHVEEVDVATAVGVAVALAVWANGAGETPGSVS